MSHTLVVLALRSGQALTELKQWHPRDVSTLADILEEDRAAERRANRK